MKKITKVTIKNRKTNKLSTGPNTVVLLDNKPLANVVSVKYSCKAGEIAKITLELIGELKVEGNFIPKFVKKQSKK